MTRVNEHRFKKTWESRRKQVDQLTANMDVAIESYFESPEQMKEYLDFMGKFYNYSARNVSLIQKQFSGAQAVGTYRFWEIKGFNVQKGEKGIKILVPNKTVPKFKDEKGKWKNIKYAQKDQLEKINKGILEHSDSKLYFSIGNVFDISQTNAKASDLPEIFPNRWLEGNVENYPDMKAALNKIGKNLDVTIGAPFEELGLAKGAFYYAVNKKGKGHIGLNPRNSELQNIKTLIHELAHAKLHHQNHENHYTLSDAEKEFQAEMTAYTVASYFDIDTNDYSLRYLSNWTKGRELKDKTRLLNEVRKTSIEFIGVIEQELVSTNEQKIKKVENLLLIKHGSFGRIEAKNVDKLTVQKIMVEFDGEKHSIDSFNDRFKEKYTLIDQKSIKEPHVVIKWSENLNIKSNSIISFDKANHLMSKISESQVEKAGYFKTWYTLIIPNDEGEIDIVATNRIDLGDGIYSSPFEQLLRLNNLNDNYISILKDQIMNSRHRTTLSSSKSRNKNYMMLDR